MHPRYTDTWDHLLDFETRDLIESCFYKRHGRKANLKKVNEVKSSFIQGREYFTNARNANFSVKPLLLYYGVVSLTKALVLYLEPRLHEESLKPSHGLEVTNWAAALNKSQFEELTVKIGTGSFSQLISATKNRNYLRHSTDAVNYYFDFPEPNVGQKIQFNSLLESFVDLRKQYQSYTGEELVFADLKSVREIDQDISISVSGSINEKNLDVLFPKELYQNRREHINHGASILYSKDAPLFHLTQKWKGAFNLGDCSIIPFQGEPYINDIGKSFIASYITGMLCRYYPSTWIGLRLGDKGDKIYPLIVALLNFVETYYPRMVLDFLKAPYDFEGKDAQE